MLECYDMDVLSYSGLDDRVGMGYLEPSLGGCEDHDWCLFSIEVRNAYGLPFEVTFERMEKGRKRATSSGPGRVNFSPR